MDKVLAGVGVLVLRDSQVLMGKRLNAHGEGTWCPPGGHIEIGETFADTAVREVLEETGCKIKNVRFAGITNDYFAGVSKHYVTIHMLSDWASGEPMIIEPEKFIEIGWFNIEKLPNPLFLPTANLVKSEFMQKIINEVKNEV